MDTQQARDIIAGVLAKNNQENNALTLALDVLDSKLETYSLAVNAKEAENEILKAEKATLISEKEILIAEKEALETK